MFLTNLCHIFLICFSLNNQLHRRFLHITIHFQTFVEMSRLVSFIGNGELQSTSRRGRSLGIIHFGTTARSHYIVYYKRLVARVLEEDFSRLRFFFWERSEIQLLDGKFHRCLDSGYFLFLARQNFQIELLDVRVLYRITDSHYLVFLVEKEST